MSLALVLHNHQPVGNFGWVIARNYDLAYAPLLAALERHPGIQVGLHYSGPLLEWLRAERPEFLARLGALVDCGRVEILGGGYYEPVLASLPEQDRIGQLRRAADEVERQFGCRPRGAWLAERVWEPDMPTSLAAAGYRWTVLDDAHFRAAAIPEDSLWGAYTTDDQGKRLAVFGSQQGLRYRIPFGEVEDVLAYLRAHASEDGSGVALMGDDGEKFGAWPTTWEHCWGKPAWVDRFFAAIEANADWLSTVTPSAWLEHHPPSGRVYIPTGSYAEMGEWALPAQEALAFSKALQAAIAEKRPEARWLRGGFWRNFQVKYREINDLHKQMLRASAKVAAMGRGPQRERALDHLYRGQSNDCYWHGLFGGIYLSHLRLATLAHLIAAEDAADLAARQNGVSVDGAFTRDLDLDGLDEVLFCSPGQVVGLKPSEGGGIGSWDIRAVRHALAAVLRRRPEAYHARLLTLAASAPGAGGRAGGGRAGETEGAMGQATRSAASIHELVRAAEPGLSGLLHYDAYERRSGLVHFLAPGTTAGSFADASFQELGDFVDRPFRIELLEPARVVLSRTGTVRAAAGPQTVSVTKIFRFDGSRRAPELALEVIAEHGGSAQIEVLLAVEWAFMMLGGGGNPAAYWELDDQRLAHDSSGSRADVTVLRSGNQGVGLALSTTVYPPAEAWWSSIDTVSTSEDGFERTHQGSCLALVWPVRLRPGERVTVSVSHRATVSRDLAEEEGL
jgi:hypothetical protein